MPRFFGQVFYQKSAAEPGTGIAGWSEVYPISSASYTSCFTTLDQLNTLRLAMATADVSALGMRISDTDILRDSYVAGLTTLTGTFPGTPSTAADAEETRRCRIAAGQLKRAVRHIHALPGFLFVNGAFIPSGPWLTAYAAWQASLVTNVSIATNLRAANPPHYTFSPITQTVDIGNGGRKVGRPFGLPRGRRSIV